MKHNIIPDLENLAYPIDKLKTLDNNPRVSDIDALMATLEEFGQHNVITVNGDKENGGYIVAGNHRFMAAKRLGWTHVAVTFVHEDEIRSIARALVDNRISELGHTDDQVLATQLPKVIDDYFEVLEVLDWDDFTVAAMEETRMNASPVFDREITAPTPVERQRDNTPEIEGRTDEEIIKTGAGNTDPKRDIVVQYTIVFNDTKQQERWYAFLKWLKADPGTDGDTISERLINFLESVADF